MMNHNREPMTRPATACTSMERLQHRSEVSARVRVCEHRERERGEGKGMRKGYLFARRIMPHCVMPPLKFDRFVSERKKERLGG